MKLLLAISGLSLLYVMYHRSETNIGEKEINKIEFGCKTVSITKTIKGYRVDSAFIRTDKSKGKLLIDLIKEDLQEIKKVREIPGFIMHFLDSKTNNKHFYMADPGEEWQTGYTAPLTPTIVKMYDIRKDDSILVTQLCCKKLPDRSLAYCGLGKHMAALSYYTGGGTTSQNLILLKFEGENITDFWYDRDTVFGASKADLVKFMKAKRMRWRENQNGC